MTRHTLQFFFCGRELKGYKILSKLGTGLSVIDNKNEIPIVGSLVYYKQGKHKRKGTPTTSPLAIVDMDIDYGESNSPGGHTNVLVLVDKFTYNTFVYGMHATSGEDVVEALWKFSLMLVDSYAPFNATLILDLLVAKLYRSFGLTAVTCVPHPFIDKIIMV